MRLLAPGCEPRYIELAGRRCFLARWSAGPSSSAVALMVQPFADEANLSRRTIRRIAERLVGCGVDVEVLDFSGTGDSAGELAYATVEQWGTEFREWVQRASVDADRPIVLVGGRLGAAMTLSFVTGLEPAPTRYVLWAPVLDGAAVVKQYLRTLVVSSKRQTVPLSGADVRDRWGRGEAVRVVGMDLSAAMVAGLEALRQPSPPPSAMVRIIERSQDDGVLGALPPTIARSVNRWRDEGASVEAAVISFEPFWNVPDPVDADGLVTAVTDSVLALIA